MYTLLAALLTLYGDQVRDAFEFTWIIAFTGQGEGLVAGADGYGRVGAGVEIGVHGRKFGFLHVTASFGDSLTGLSPSMTGRGHQQDH